MVGSPTKTVEDYLAQLPPERCTVVSAVRDLVNTHLPPGYVETMNWGMISWEIPLARYPDTYNGQPLMFAALAAQKNHYGLYLTCVYIDPAREAALREGFASAGRKLDMGKSCLRFKRLDDLPLPVIAGIVASTPVDDYIAHYQARRRR